jgi:hypothetical protein
MRFLSFPRKRESGASKMDPGLRRDDSRLVSLPLKRASAFLVGTAAKPAVRP